MQQHDQLIEMLKRPTMYIRSHNFDLAAAFVSGFDQACENGVLVGFREWLIPQLGYGNNLAWVGLVLRWSFPDTESVNEALAREGGHEHAINQLSELLHGFWEQRDQHNGLLKIYVAYQHWLDQQELDQQDWYDPSVQ